MINRKSKLGLSNYGVGENGGQSYGTSYDIAGTNLKRNQIGNDDIKWETTTDRLWDFALAGTDLVLQEDQGHLGLYARYRRYG